MALNILKSGLGIGSQRDPAPASQLGSRMNSVASEVGDLDDFHNDDDGVKVGRNSRRPLTIPMAIPMSVKAKNWKDLGPQAIIRGTFKRMVKIIIKVSKARFLPRADTLGKADPFCVVKGIRNNSHVFDIGVTPVVPNSLNPVWDAFFSFVTPESWGISDVVGLKFLIFDSDNGHGSLHGADDFLGGATVDLSDQPERKEVQHELELSGAAFRTKTAATAKKSVRPRLTVQVEVQRELTIKPLPPEEYFKETMKKRTRIAVVEGTVVRAENLRNTNVSSETSDTWCRVQALSLDGYVRELLTTAPEQNNLNPVWREPFFGSFKADDEPLFLLFDVFCVGANGVNQHIGSVWFPLCKITDEKLKYRLELQGDWQLLEKRDNPDKGDQSAAAVMPAGALSGKVASKSNQESGGIVSWMMSKLQQARAKPLAQNESNILVVEIHLHLVSEPMPHVDLLMSGPQEVTAEITDDGRRLLPGQRAQRRAEERIVCVYGFVHGATALPNADISGKSDPYCVVEGFSRLGKKHFIYRTRCIDDELCPMWNEVFCVLLPEDFELQRLVFSVYDSDEDLLGGDEDALLGSASLDLSHLTNHDVLASELALLGVKDGKRAKSGSVLKLVPAINVEVCVVRRIQCVVEIKRPPTAPSTLPRHCITAMPSSLNEEFSDPSQEEIFDEDDAFRHVVSLCSQPGSLLKQGRKRNARNPDLANAWMTVPELNKLTGQRANIASLKKHKEEYEQQLRHLRDSNFTLSDDRTKEEHVRQKMRLFGSLRQEEMITEAQKDLSEVAKAGWLPKSSTTQSLPALRCNTPKSSPKELPIATSSESSLDLRFDDKLLKGLDRRTKVITTSPPVRCLTHIRGMDTRAEQKHKRRSF